MVHSPVPLPQRTLFVVHPGTGGVPADSTELPPAPVPPPGTGAAAVPVLASSPVRMAVPERAVLAARHWAGTAAGELWFKPDRVAFVLWHGKPESMAEHRAYIKSRAWVPPEMTGKSAALIAFAGIAYHLLIARPVKAAARTADAAAERPLRFLMLAVFLVALILILPL